MIKVAFFDVDGTLLSHNTRQVPQSTRQALKKLREAGILCVVATGRHICQFAHLPVDDLEFDGYLTLNGQICLDRNRQILYGCPLEGGAKEIILDVFHKKETPVLLVEEDKIYLNFVNDRVRYVQDCISSPVAQVLDYSGKDLFMACMYISGEEAGILTELWPDCEITWWTSESVDIIAKGGGKAVAIEKYLASQGLTPEEAIAFGDGYNDLEMLQFVGTGVAMGNAEAQVKQAADYVTTDVDDHGIANALRYFGLIE